MKKFKNLKISPQNILGNDELLCFKGGTSPCGNHCNSSTECGGGCPNCGDAPGYPVSKICLSPGMTPPGRE